MKKIMTDEEWEHYQKNRDTIQSNNKALATAAITGDLEKVAKLTTDPNYNGLIEVDCAHNYPLRGACLRGHVHVINFLVNFPNEEIRNKIATPENIRAAIRCSAEYHQPASFLYFKEHFPTEYYEIINNKDYWWANQTIASLVAKDNLETIELLLAEFPKDTKYKYAFFIKEAIRYNKRNCFDYFLPKVSNQELKKYKEQEDIIHTSLYNKRFDYLSVLMKTGAINLNKNLTLKSFRILVEAKFDSLVHIVQEYNYQPNKKVMSEIIDCVNRKEEYALKNCVINFVNMLEKHQLKTKLDKDIIEKSEKQKQFKRKL